MATGTSDPLLEQAEFAVEQYAAEHPEYRVDSEQPDYRGGTNRIILGHRGSEPVVFKYFVTRSRWANELFCLRHFQPAGIVPAVLDVVPERLIVMERLGGSDGLAEVAAGAVSAGPARELSRQIGQALGKIANTPLPVAVEGYSPLCDFTGLKWFPRPNRMLEYYLAACRRIQSVIPAYADPFCTASLSLLSAQAPHVDSERQILFHEDIWNLRVQAGQFVGFYDLEMCRPGTESMQLGVALELCGPDRLDWSHLQRGYETEVGRVLDESDLLAALAMNHFYHWIRICRWGEWNGDPEETVHRDTAARDAGHYLTRMKAACHVIGRHIDLRERFTEGTVIPQETL